MVERGPRLAAVEVRAREVGTEVGGGGRRRRRKRRALGTWRVGVEGGVRSKEQNLTVAPGTGHAL